jgi:hypothetical protein
MPGIRAVPDQMEGTRLSFRWRTDASHVHVPYIRVKTVIGARGKQMNDDEQIIPSGPFKGKKIQFAPTTGIDMFVEIAEDFMRRILAFEPGEYHTGRRHRHRLGSDCWMAASG